MRRRRVGHSPHRISSLLPHRMPEGSPPRRAGSAATASANVTAKVYRILTCARFAEVTQVSSLCGTARTRRIQEGGNSMQGTKFATLLRIAANAVSCLRYQHSAREKTAKRTNRNIEGQASQHKRYLIVISNSNI